MEESDSNAICRLCLEDLTQFSEYYEIDDNLSEMILNLTTITIYDNDSLSVGMCPNCFNILNTFNESKSFWINNQKLLIDANEDMTVKQEEEITEDLSYEQVEFVEEIENTEYIIESNQDDNSQSGTETVKTRKYQKKSLKSPESSQKAKEIYKSLLKECELCGKLIEKNRLEGHMNKHEGKKPFVCDFANCGKTFYCRLLRRLHQTSIHTGQQVVCQICEKTFPSERSLYTHSLRHKNADRYKCDHCEKSFNNSNSLKRHLAIHSGIREWKCDFCPSSFYRKFNLDVHVRTVHQKEKSYACNYCAKKFGYSRLLRQHVKKFHEENENSIEFVEEVPAEC